MFFNNKPNSRTWKGDLIIFTCNKAFSYFGCNRFNFKDDRNSYHYNGLVDTKSSQSRVKTHFSTGVEIFQSSMHKWTLALYACDCAAFY